MTISLRTTFRKATPAVCLLGLAGILTGCGPEQEQVEPLITPYVHSASYVEPMTTAVPQGMRHHQRTPHVFQSRHAAPPPMESLNTIY